MTQRAQARWTRWGLPMAGGVLFAFVYYTLISHPWPGFPYTMDYLSWYSAGRIALDGRVAEVYNLEVQRVYQAAALAPTGFSGFPTPGGVLVYNRAPFFLWPVMALAWLPYLTSYVLWSALAVLCGAAALWLCVTRIHTLPTPAPVARWGQWMVLAFAFWPVYQGLLLGQTSLLELLALAAFYVLYRANRQVAAGAVLGLTLYKPHLTIFFAAYLLLQGAWPALVSMSAVGLGLGLLCLPLGGLDNLLAYLRLTGEMAQWNCWNGVNPDIHQSWRGVFVGLLVPRCAEAGAHPEVSTLPMLRLADQLAQIVSLLTLLPLAVALWRWRTARMGSPASDLSLAALALASLLASPYANPQDLTRLVFVAVLLARVAQHAPQALPGARALPVLCAACIVLGPFATIEAARTVHPLVWLMLLAYGTLCYALWRVQPAASSGAFMISHVEDIPHAI